MLGELLIPAWTLVCVTVGVILGYTVSMAAQSNNDDEDDDGPGAVEADELDR